MFNYNPTINALRQQSIEKAKRLKELKEESEQIIPGKIKIIPENIVIVGAEVHDLGKSNKLFFMAQAIRKVKIENIQTVLYFKEGYSSSMISSFIKSLKHFKPKINIIEVSTVEEVFNYINVGDVNGIKNIRTKSANNALYKINRIFIYSHGMPSRITFLLDWDKYKINNKIESPIMAEKNELNLKNYQKISPNAFIREAYIWSFACRTGLAPEDDNWEFQPDFHPDESVAQKLADKLNVHVCAYLRRSYYGDTWGNDEDRDKFHKGNIYDILGVEYADDDDFRKYEKNNTFLDGKYLWNFYGAYHGVRGGDSPKGPPQEMKIFVKKH